MNAAGCYAECRSSECHSGECRGAVLFRPTQVLGTMGLFEVPPPAPVTTATLPSNLNISEKFFLLKKIQKFNFEKRRKNLTETSFLSLRLKHRGQEAVFLR